MLQTHSIAKRVVQFLSAILLIVLLIVGWLQYQEQRSQTLRSMQLYGEAIIGNLVKFIQMIGLETSNIQSLVVGISTEPKFERIVVVDSAGTIRAHSDPRQVGKTFVKVEKWRGLSSRQSYFFSLKYPALEQREHGNRHRHPLMQIVAPIESLSTKIEAIGVVIIDLDLTDDMQQFHARQINVGATLLLLLIVVIGAIYLFINQYIILPIIELQRTAAIIAQGNLQERVAIQRKDELGLLAQSFNQMVKILSAPMVSKIYLDNIIQSMTDLLIVVSEKGIIETANHPDHLGYDEEELIGVFMDEFFLEKDILNRAKRESLILIGSFPHTEANLVRKDGCAIPVFLSGSPMRGSEGEITGTIIIAKDVSDFKKSQEELKKKDAQLVHSGRLASLGEMSTGVAHELNQPLAIVRMISENLQEELEMGVVDQANLIDVTNTIMGQVDRASIIINHMRSFARGEQNEKTVATDLSVPTQAALSFFQEQFRVHNIQFSTDIGENLPMVVVQANRFEQVVVNFLSNARYAVEKKAASDSAFKKKIELKLFFDLNAQFLVFQVADNGIGMTLEERERCLEPFFTTKDVGQGTGLGLHIIRGIVDEMKGHLEVESEPGQGALFRVRLPVVS